MNLPKRKSNRLKDYDYSQNGAYFITICTKDKKEILSRINKSADNIHPNMLVCDSVGANSVRPNEVNLTAIGEVAEKGIAGIEKHYKNVFADNHVIMPNHIHLIIRIDINERREGGRTLCAPTVSQIIRQFKEFVTKQIGENIWQKSFYDHIIRDEEDYRTKWEYIENNPNRWSEDELYITKN